MKSGLIHSVFNGAFAITSLLCMAEKPNVLWITIEDTSPQFIGCYGNEHVHTPHMDRLAEEGVRFTQAFATAPVCAAARSTLITGIPNEIAGTGNHRSRMPLPDFVQGFPSYLRDAGYYTSNNVKTDYNTSHAQRLIQNSWHESSRQAGWWNRDSLQPFFSVFNFMESHQSYTMTHPWNWYQEFVIEHLDEHEITSADAFEMPPFYRDTPEMRKHLNRVYNSLNLTDKRIGELLERLDDDGLRESTIIFLYADHGQGIPRAKSNSIGLSYRVPMIIWFPEKYRHLSPWGINTVSDELISFTDLPPTILSLAGAEIPEYMNGRPFMGQQRKDSWDYIYTGRNRIDETPGLERSVSDGRFIYTRVFLPQFPGVRYQKYSDVSDIKKIIRKDQSKGKLNDTQEEMLLPRKVEYLYDLHNDPWEIHNLAGKVEYSDRLVDMRNQLKSYLLEVMDIHFLPEYELNQIAETVNPMQYRLKNGERVRKTISSAWKAMDTATESGELIEMLHDVDPWVRYWASKGLGYRKESLREGKQVLSDIYENENYLLVRVNLAASLYELSGGDEYAKAILDYAYGENLDLALHALQLIQYMETDKRAFFLPGLRKLLKAFQEGKPSNYHVLSSCEMILFVDEGYPIYYENMLPWIDEKELKPMD